MSNLLDSVTSLGQNNIIVHGQLTGKNQNLVAEERKSHRTSWRGEREEIVSQRWWKSPATSQWFLGLSSFGNPWTRFMSGWLSIKTRRFSLYLLLSIACNFVGSSYSGINWPKPRLRQQIVDLFFPLSCVNSVFLSTAYSG